MTKLLQAARGMRGSPLGLAALALIPVALTPSPAVADIVVLNPNGPVAAKMAWLFWVALGLMAIVVVPVFTLVPLFVWRYRASRRGTYRPEWDASRRLEVVIWLVPALIIVALSYLVWTRTFELDPYKQVGAGDPLDIQAIALDWRWLFIYPEQNVAVLNELAVPAGRPFRVELTADTVMNAFFIPGLGGQIFAMAGMRTELNLLADAPAQMWGRNMQFTGKQFPNQRFAVKVTKTPAFKQWIAKARAQGTPLTKLQYQALASAQSEAPVRRYAPVADGLFDDVIASYRVKN